MHLKKLMVLSFMVFVILPLGHLCADDVTLPSETATGSWSVEPVIQISKWGEETRLLIHPASEMGSEEQASIDSIRLESLQGELLGSKTCEPGTPDRTAEFMIDLKALKMDAIRIVVHSTTLGDWSSVMTMEELAGKSQKQEDSPAAKAPEA